MPRGDPHRYPNLALKVQRRGRFRATENKQAPYDTEEPGISLSRIADASGMPAGLNLYSRTAVSGREPRHANLGDSLSPELLALQLQVNELQRLLRSKMVENAILTEAIEVARQHRDCCAHRHRR